MVSFPPLFLSPFWTLPDNFEGKFILLFLSINFYIMGKEDDPLSQKHASSSWGWFHWSKDLVLRRDVIFWRWRHPISKSWWSFSPDTLFKPYDPLIQPNFISSSWVCFPEYPFSLGLKFPFSGVISEFFKVTKLPYIQVTPIIWRIMYSVEHLNQTHDRDMDLAKLSHVYDLSTFDNSRFLFKFKFNKSPLVLKTKHSDGAWKERYFFVRRDSIPNEDLLPK